MPRRSHTPPPPLPERPWHALTTEEALDAVEASHDGLAHEEAARRLEVHGLNRLDPPRGRGPIMRFLMQFHDVLIYVLLASGVVTALLGHWVDTGVIFGVVVINAIIGFIQEGKAEKAMEAIRDMLSSHAVVWRGGERHTVPAEHVVPGDIVHLQSGDKVPADLRLTWVKGLQVQEAALTGESVAVEKAIHPVAEESALGDRRAMAYSGTLVTYGQAHGVVVGTGMGTEIGKISSMLSKVQPLTTPLMRQMATFGKWLTVGILGIAAVTFAFGVLVRGYLPDDMFLAAVGLAVAAIPEGLPAIMTITLAIGVERMARRNAIIRRLPAVETLGSVGVICSDKTGTLTRNEMTVQSVATADCAFAVTGAGYAPVGEVTLDGARADLEAHPLLGELSRAAALCGDAKLRQGEDGGEWTVDGDPMEGALLTLAIKAGWDLEFEHKAWPRTDVIPFESEHKFMATLHHDHAGNGMIYVKGATERLLAMCAHERTRAGDVPLDAAAWHARLDAMAAQGQRVLALAAKPTHGEHRDLLFSDVEEGLVLLGLFGIADPPRDEAIEAVARCKAAGITVKMITGDHAATAAAIGTRLGLDGGQTALTGAELDALDDDALAEAIGDVTVFARTTPAHKLRLVEALQAKGKVVAMTGDGVNDSPALKRADVGVAMGMNGTEAAREAAEMVLADDNFASISHAVEEGRTVYDNIKKAITFILPTNGAEGLTMMAAIVLGMMLPITAVQILWVNMITAVTLGLALAFEAPESAVMDRPPRDPSEPLLSGFLIWRIAFVAVIATTGVFGLFLWERQQGTDIETARTVAVNTLVMFEVFYLFNSRHLLAPVLSWEGMFGSRPVLIGVVLVVIFQIVFTYAPPFQFLFDTRALTWEAWARATMVGASVLVLVEIEKTVLRRLFGRR